MKVSMPGWRKWATVLLGAYLFLDELVLRLCTCSNMDADSSGCPRVIGWLNPEDLKDGSLRKARCQEV